MSAFGIPLPILAFVILATTGFDLHAQSCAVPSQFGTIRAAIAAPACALVSVGPGTYAEEVFVARTVALEGAGPAQTVIAGRVAVLAGGDLHLSELAVASICVPALTAVPGGLVEVDGVEAHAVPQSTGSPPCPLFAGGFE